MSDKNNSKESSSFNSLDERETKQAPSKRFIFSVSFKLDVCNYLREHNMNVSLTANFFNIKRKQVRYFNRRCF